MMRTFALTCSSTADMPLEYFTRREIPFVCFRFTIDGKDYADDLGQSIPIDAFYKMIAAGAMPTTTQVNAAQFVEFFEPLLAAGQDVLHLELSSGISGSYGSAVMAQKELARRYPQRKLYIVDSLGASSGFGLLVDAAADMRDAGASIDEAHDWVEQNKLNVHHWFFTTDLTHFKRGGRISVASATFGTMFNICPIMNVDKNGKLTPRAKVRGKKNAIHESLKRMLRHARGGADYASKCYISQSACFGDARLLADQVEEAFSRLDGRVMINNIGTVIGAHTGPGTVALFFFGDKRVD